jgi:hypothetical protein
MLRSRAQRPSHSSRVALLLRLSLSIYLSLCLSLSLLNERQPKRTKEYKLMYDRLLYKKRIEYYKNYYKTKKLKLEAIKQGLITIDRY